ncbi:MAG: hypothetical protein AB7K37_02990 [Cyclobacteriaceae bacterium]
MPANKFTLLTLCLVIGFGAQAQTVKVEEQNKKIKGEDASGYQTTLEGAKEDVSAAWARFLKDVGKTKQALDYITVTDPAMGGTVYSKAIVYALSDGNAESTAVWLGIIESEWKVNDISLVTKELEKLTYQFGVKYYRDKIQAQIDEAVRALNAVERQQQRLVTQNRDLNIKLGNNEQEKVQLEKSLEANKLEHAVLLVKIENNKTSQDSVVEAGEQIKKVIELHKERQRKVN